MVTKKHTQYALIYKPTGEYAGYEDETPLVANDLNTLLAMIPDWWDDCASFQEAVAGGLYNAYEIVREEVHTFPLAPEEREFVQTHGTKE